MNGVTLKKLSIVFQAKNFIFSIFFKNKKLKINIINYLYLRLFSNIYIRSSYIDSKNKYRGKIND